MGAAPPAAATDLGFDTAKVDEAIGFKGRNNNGVYQFGVPRSDSIKQDGMAIPGAMGTAIAINFQPTGERQGGDHRRLRRARRARSIR